MMPDNQMGKKITIYMLDGTPTGTKTVEIGNWAGKAIFAPRAALKNIIQRPEFNCPGVYFLQNATNSTEYSDSIYIGEAEQLRARLKTHIAERDFESVVCFLSKDELLTKAHIKYLEARLIAIAKAANNALIENTNSPKLPRLSEADISDMEYFIAQIRVILPMVGMQTLVTAIRHAKTLSSFYPYLEKYKIKSKSLTATMIETEDGFIVLAGSQANAVLSKSLADGWVKIRKKLLDAGVLVANEEHLAFVEDTFFSSPSAASSVILARQAPGPAHWIGASGQTYKEMQQSYAQA